jgi:hypothetical protein
MLKGFGLGYWENQQEVWVNTTRIAKTSANPKIGSNHKYFAGERQVGENPELTQRRSNHHLPARILGFFGGKKIIKCSLPATNHQNTLRINSFRLPTVFDGA